jgi:hypothetical protein
MRGRAGTAHKKGRETLRVRVRPGIVRKGGVTAGMVRKGSRTSLWVILWVSLRVSL